MGESPGKYHGKMKEFEIIKEALDIATQRGCYNLDQASRLAHCVGVVGAKLSPPVEPPKAEGKPEKVLTK